MGIESSSSVCDFLECVWGSGNWAVITDLTADLIYKLAKTLALNSLRDVKSLFIFVPMMAGGVSGMH